MVIDSLSNLLSEADSLPFLFIGSGFSKRYLNLPTWDELLEEVSKLISDKPHYYSQQKAIVKQTINSEKNYNLFMTSLCDRLSNDLTEIWYTDDRFENSRKSFSSLIDTTDFLPIKAEISNIILNKSAIQEAMKEEIDYLRSISKHSISGVITTNYDTFLEDIFNFKVYNSQNELLFNTNYEVGEIYKIHGNVSNPNSIMITSKDYELMEERNKYLAAKLLTIFVEHPIIFIGYSINDENIRSILDAIAKCLDSDQKQILSSRLIFIEWLNDVNDCEKGNYTISFDDGTSLNMTKYTLNSFGPLFNTIGLHKSKMPVQVLRKLKHSMYDLALTTEGNTRIQVINPEQIIESDDYEIIAGFGIADLARRGYKSITTKEIFLDIVLDNQSYNNEYLVTETLPTLLKSVNGSLPFYKYTRDFSDVPEEITRYSKEQLNDFLPKSMRDRNPISFKSIKEIVDEHKDYSKQLSLIALLKENINKEELEVYLKKLLEEEPNIFEESQPIPTNLRRLIKIYDWLKYAQ